MYIVSILIWHCVGCAACIHAKSFFVKRVDCLHYHHNIPHTIGTLIVRFIGPTWGPPGADRTTVVASSFCGCFILWLLHLMLRTFFIWFKRCKMESELFCTKHKDLYTWTLYFIVSSPYSTICSSIFGSHRQAWHIIFRTSSITPVIWG